MSGRHVRTRGNNTTASPHFLIHTSVPEKRNSLGNRTAWLSPFLNSFAVFNACCTQLYILFVYTQINARRRAAFPVCSLE